MRKEIKTVDVMCDACGASLNNQIVIVNSMRSNFVTLGDRDYCMQCSMDILENLYRSEVINNNNLDEAAKHYAISARSQGSILC